MQPKQCYLLATAKSKALQTMVEFYAAIGIEVKPKTREKKYYRQIFLQMKK